MNLSSNLLGWKGTLTKVPTHYLQCLFKFRFSFSPIQDLSKSVQISLILDYFSLIHKFSLHTIFIFESDWYRWSGRKSIDHTWKVIIPWMFVIDWYYNFWERIAPSSWTNELGITLCWVVRYVKGIAIIWLPMHASLYSWQKRKFIVKGKVPSKEKFNIERWCRITHITV